MTVTSTASRETLGFQAEVKQLLQLMIHSLYSNREIFLRELISNASDACDKLRFESLHNAGLLEGGGDFRIDIAFDAAARTITVTDNGVGMNRDEVVSHLGTIAKSGTREFFSQLSGDQQKDACLIGQFGVGLLACGFAWIVFGKWGPGALLCLFLVMCVPAVPARRPVRVSNGSPTAAASSPSR